LHDHVRDSFDSTHIQRGFSLAQPLNVHMLDPSMICLTLVRNVHFSGPEKFRTFPIRCHQATKNFGVRGQRFPSIQIMDIVTTGLQQL
jgi:hypothetical protein